MPITPDDLCVPTTAATPFTREGWLFELKYDGFRILATKQGNDIALLSRRGTDFADQFPELAAEMAKLPNIVLDAELVMLDANGKPLFEPLVRRSRLKRKISIDDASRKAPAVLYAFDVLELDGRDLRDLPLVQRKEALQKALARAERILPVGHFDRDGVSLFQLAAQNGIEGILAKRADSPYRAGRSFDWIKIKTSIGRAIDVERAKWHERPSSGDKPELGSRRGGRFGRRRR